MSAPRRRAVLRLNSDEVRHADTLRLPAGLTVDRQLGRSDTGGVDLGIVGDALDEVPEGTAAPRWTLSELLELYGQP